MPVVRCSKCDVCIAMEDNLISLLMHCLQTSNAVPPQGRRQDPPTYAGTAALATSMVGASAAMK